MLNYCFSAPHSQPTHFSLSQWWFSLSWCLGEDRSSQNSLGWKRPYKASGSDLPGQEHLWPDQLAPKPLKSLQFLPSTPSTQGSPPLLQAGSRTGPCGCCLPLAGHWQVGELPCIYHSLTGTRAPCQETHLSSIITPFDWQAESNECHCLRKARRKGSSK